MPSPYLCERFHPTRGCVSPNFRPETTFSKVAGRLRTADLQTRRLPLNPLLHGGLTVPECYQFSCHFAVPQKGCSKRCWLNYSNHSNIELEYLKSLRVKQTVVLMSYPKIINNNIELVDKRKNQKV
jgi:hypothetical protein